MSFTTKDKKGTTFFLTHAKLMSIGSKRENMSSYITSRGFWL